MANPARAYLATQVETTTQGELLIMLYEAAIKFLKRAKIEIGNKDYAKKGIYISKAMAIIHELSESLNKEKGGDITPRLAQLYMFCTSQLIKANIRMDTKMIDDVIKILDGIRSAYAQIVPEVDGKAAPGDKRSFTRQPTPQAPPMQPNIPVQPQVAPQSGGAYAKSPQPAPAQAAQPNPAPQAAPQPPAAGQTPPPASKPAPPKPSGPPKLRSAFNNAKFRAANAYGNNNG